MTLCNVSKMALTVRIASSRPSLVSRNRYSLSVAFGISTRCWAMYRLTASATVVELKSDLVYGGVEAGS